MVNFRKFQKKKIQFIIHCRLRGILLESSERFSVCELKIPEYRLRNFLHRKKVSIKVACFNYADSLRKLPRFSRWPFLCDVYGFSVSEVWMLSLRLSLAMAKVNIHYYVTKQR